MNYIKEINAFYHKLDFQPLSGAAVSLWHGLMHFNNRCGWKEEFSVTAAVLQAKACLKPTTFKNAREELQRLGYIRVISQSGNRAAIYQMISQQEELFGHTAPTNQVQAEDANTDLTEILSKPDVLPDEISDHKPAHTSGRTTDDKSGHKSDRKPDPLYKQIHKQDQTKQNRPAAEDAVRFHQENFGVASPFVAEEIISWIDDTNEKLVLHAMKLAVTQGKTNWRYVTGILKAWKRKGITTVEQAELEEKAFRQQHVGKPHYNQHQPQEEIVPDWFKDRKEKAAVSYEETTALPKDANHETEEIERLLAKVSGRECEVIA
ncbi:DnaD domain-containing protein [Virgibacillus xinjiangensis]|uniref:DnaD domain-containing protein n=1 Tax=Virgibacillus xinjiangensis TaxID=393090 RepID=A0ABV7CW61_9BACI